MPSLYQGASNSDFFFSFLDFEYIILLFHSGSKIILSDSPARIELGNLWK